MSCCLKTTLKDQKQHALSGRAASVFWDLSPFLNHMQKLNLSFTAKPEWYEPDHPLIM